MVPELRRIAFYNGGKRFIAVMTVPAGTWGTDAAAILVLHLYYTMNCRYCNVFTYIRYTGI
jgi:hypothetical protein